MTEEILRFDDSCIIRIQSFAIGTRQDLLFAVRNNEDIQDVAHEHARIGRVDIVSYPKKEEAKSN